MDSSDIGKIAKCQNCGKEKEIHYEGMKEDKIISKLCKECFDLETEVVKCEICGFQLSRKDLDNHKIDHEKLQQ